jgi:hypothetical protein
MTGGEDLAGGGFLQHPLAGPVAAPPQVRRQSHPVVVHIRAERRRRGVGGDAPGFPRDLGQREAEAPQLARHCHAKIAVTAQVVEVILEKRVVAVVSGRAGPEFLQGGFWYKSD